MCILQFTHGYFDSYICYNCLTKTCETLDQILGGILLNYMVCIVPSTSLAFAFDRYYSAISSICLKGYSIVILNTFYWQISSLLCTYYRYELVNSYPGVDKFWLETFNKFKYLSFIFVFLWSDPFSLNRNELEGTRGSKRSGKVNKIFRRE